MTSRRSVTCIRGGIGAREAESMLGSGHAQLAVYYPYYCFLAHNRARRITYLLDARTGRVATADPFRVETLDVSGEHVLNVSVDAERAHQIAQRYLVGRVVARGGLVHKPFWVLSLPSGRMLMDALTAKIHPLSATF